MNEEVFQAVGDALQRGEPAALVTIIRTEGSTPQRGRGEDAGFRGRADGGNNRRWLL